MDLIIVQRIVAIETHTDEPVAVTTLEERFPEPKVFWSRTISKHPNHAVQIGDEVHELRKVRMKQRLATPAYENIDLSEFTQSFGNTPEFVPRHIFLLF